MPSEESLKKADAFLAGYREWNRRETAAILAGREMRKVQQRIRELRTQPPTAVQVAKLKVLEQGMRNLLHATE